MVATNGNHSESYYVDNFLSRLKEEISSSLYLNKPLNLKEATDKARRQESLIELMDRRDRNQSKGSVGSTNTKPVFNTSKTTTYTPK